TAPGTKEGPRPNGGAGWSALSLEGNADPPLCWRSRGCVHHIARTRERNETLTPRSSVPEGTPRPLYGRSVPGRNALHRSARYVPARSDDEQLRHRLELSRRQRCEPEARSEEEGHPSTELSSLSVLYIHIEGGCTMMTQARARVRDARALTIQCPRCGHEGTS